MARGNVENMAAVLSWRVSHACNSMLVFMSVSPPCVIFGSFCSRGRLYPSGTVTHLSFIKEFERVFPSFPSSKSFFYDEKWIIKLGFITLFFSSYQRSKNSGLPLLLMSAAKWATSWGVQLTARWRYHTKSARCADGVLT